MIYRIDLRCVVASRGNARARISNVSRYHYLLPALARSFSPSGAFSLRRHISAQHKHIARIWRLIRENMRALMMGAMTTGACMCVSARSSFLKQKKNVKFLCLLATRIVPLTPSATLYDQFVSIAHGNEWIHGIAAKTQYFSAYSSEEGSF